MLLMSTTVYYFCRRHVVDVVDSNSNFDRFFSSVDDGLLSVDDGLLSVDDGLLSVDNTFFLMSTTFLTFSYKKTARIFPAV